MKQRVKNQPNPAQFHAHAHKTGVVREFGELRFRVKTLAPNPATAQASTYWVTLNVGLYFFLVAQAQVHGIVLRGFKGRLDTINNPAARGFQNKAHPQHGQNSPNYQHPPA